jgi:hypothetical protein
LLCFKEQYSNSISPLKAFDRLGNLRARDKVFQQGNYHFQRMPNGVHVHTRVIPKAPEEPIYMLLVNWQETSGAFSTVDPTLSKLFEEKQISGKAEVQFSQITEDLN